MRLCVMLLTIAVGSATAGPGVNQRRKISHFYRELGCTTQDESTFNCPERPDPKKCYVKGRSFDIGVALPDELESPCSVLCKCSGRSVYTGRTGFECAQVECPDLLNPDSSESDCVRTYTEEDRCCSSGKVCGEQVKSLATCDVNGVSYREGQEFYPENSCHKCICTASFNGTIEGADYCQKIDCGVEINYQSQLMDNCAPLMTQSSCCPFITWICPNNDTEIIKADTPSEVKGTCMFGNETLAVGDEVKGQKTCIKCICEVPPFVTCSQLEQGCYP